jgi:hypothetical protein
VAAVKAGDCASRLEKVSSHHTFDNGVSTRNEALGHTRERNVVHFYNYMDVFYYATAAAAAADKFTESASEKSS